MKEELEKIEQEAINITRETTIGAERVIAVVEAWFVKHFHNSPISRNGAVIAKLLEAKEDLKNQIKKL